VLKHNVPLLLLLIHSPASFSLRKAISSKHTHTHISFLAKTQQKHKTSNEFYNEGERKGYDDDDDGE
jgi:hypothetical protein